MPLRYLSLTLIVTERKAHCFLTLSYLACRWMSQFDCLFGQQWEYYHLAFAQLWHGVPMYRTCKKYSPCSWGTEMLKRFVSSHYPLSNVSIWGGWLPSVLEGSGWIEGPWAEYLALARSPQAVHLCVDVTWFPKSGCDLPAIDLTYLFSFLKRSLYKCYFKPKPRVAAVIMMPRNPGARLFLGPEFL